MPPLRWLGAAAVVTGLIAGFAPAARSAGLSQPRAASLPPAGLPAMSLAQLAGQRIIYSYQGLTPPASLKTLIREGKAGGVIFFSGNISSSAQIHRVIQTLQRLNRSSPAREPLLMMTDQEGGLVRRLPGPPLRSQKQIGQSANPPAAAASAGRGAGLNLLGAGLNVNLAPVLDVYRKAGSFIDRFGRSYSSNPTVVSRLGASFIRAQQVTGVAATAKHFPGLGAAARSTDLGPVTLNLPLSQIRSAGEYPYRAAITAGVHLVMVSWAVYPALARRPAGLSSAIVQGELRQRLGFRGVTITDALEAGALRGYGSPASRGVLAAKAGLDLLLYAGRNVSDGTSGLHALVAALRSGTLSRSACGASVARVLALRAQLAG